MLPYPWELGAITTARTHWPYTFMCTPISSPPASGTQQVMAFTRPTMCTSMVNHILTLLHELLPDASPGAHPIYEQPKILNKAPHSPQATPPSHQPAHQAQRKLSSFFLIKSVLIKK